jgi:hypothetical protein
LLPNAGRALKDGPTLMASTAMPANSHHEMPVMKAVHGLRFRWSPIPVISIPS